MRYVLIFVVSVCMTACGGSRKSAAVSRAVNWTEAQRLLRDCQVKAVGQTHSRLVNLKLRDGSTTFTHEPQIDDIFRTLRRLPRSCAPRTVATE